MDQAEVLTSWRGRGSFCLLERVVPVVPHAQIVGMFDMWRALFHIVIDP